MNVRFTKVHIWMDTAIAPELGVLVARRIGDSTTSFVGMFVDDSTLRRFASLPMARYVSRLSLREEPASDATIEHELQIRRDELQRRFRRSLGLGVGDSGQATLVTVQRQQLLRDLRPGELLIVARPDAATWVGTRWFDIVSPLTCDVLFVNGSWATGRTVAVLADPADTHGRAAALATEVARREGLSLVVLQPGAAGRESPPGGAATVACEVNADALLVACQRLDARLLVVPAGAALDWLQVSHSLLELLDCSLLVVGSTTAAADAG